MIENPKLNIKKLDTSEEDLIRHGSDINDESVNNLKKDNRHNHSISMES